MTAPITARRSAWRWLVVVVALCCMPSAARPEALTQADLANGWLNLYDGSLFGWNTTSIWHNQADILSGPAGVDRKIIYALPMANFEIRFMFRVTQTQTGAAFRLRTTADASLADNGFRVPLADGDPSWPSGSIVNKAKSTMSLSAGAWHSVSVEAADGRVTVKMDGQQTASAADGGVKAGYFGFESKQDSGLELREIHLLPKGMDKIFNGTDLSGWKNVPYEKPASGGVFHPVEKMFGGGGGGKPHSAKWTVNGGKIVGEKGPGALETNATYQDFVLQIASSAETKKDGFPAVYIRNDAGKMFTGYGLGIGPKTGQIQGIGQPRRAIAAREETFQTVIAANRQLGVFVNGVLMTLATDTRPEGNSEKVGARTSGGVISLGSEQDNETVSFRTVAIQPMQRPFGGLVQAEMATISTVAPAMLPIAPDESAKAATQNAQLAAALGVMDPKQKAEIATLMSSAVRSKDPQEQMGLYNRIIQMDPSNAAAVQGYKDAQAKLEAQQKSQAQDIQQQQTQQETRQSTQAQVAAAQSSAQTAFLAGHLREADRSLALAERLAPPNPATRDLRYRISAATSLRSRLLYLGSGAGLVTLVGMFWFWRSRKREQRSPVLEMTRGLEQGRIFPLDKDVVRIGAVKQDGGQRNDIVVEDVEHMISRFHCELHRKDGSFFLIDSGSSNGTKVNGSVAAPRTPVPVRKGSRIDLGGTAELRFGYDRRPKA